MIACLPISILGHELITIYSNVVGGMEDLSDHWQYNELNVLLVGMVLEHVNGGHQGSLHG